MDGNDLIGQLAATGATTLIAAMASDLWEQVRNRVARLFGRGDPRQEAAVSERLDLAQRDLTAGPQPAPDLLREHEIEWRGALRLLLAQHPETQHELQRILAEYGQQVGGSSQLTEVHQDVRVEGHATAYTAGRDQTNIVHRDTHA
jgi:hypothetical protein